MLRHSSHRLTGTKSLAFAAAAALGLLTIFAAAPRTARAQTIEFERQRARMMLDTIKDDIKNNYYDPKFRGIDLDARFKKAEEELKAAKEIGQVLTIMAQTLLDFHDSHTFFIPPSRYYHTEYGWRMQMIGDKCYVTAVKPGSDAASKGLKEGDRLLSVNGFKPTKDSLWILDYYYGTLAPQQQMKLIAQSPDGKVRSLDVQAEIRERKKVLGPEDYFSTMVREGENEAHLNRHIGHVLAGDVFIWKMPHFDLNKEEVDEWMGKIKKRKALILDMRGNGGGSEITMLRVLGNLFDHDVTIGSLKSRKEGKPVVAKTLGSDNFKGKLVVLVDSRSGSASEVVARVVQLEKRGTVVGDRSAGAVMRAKFFPHTQGQDTYVSYGVSVTDSDLVMTDGKSLEGTGVVPDVIILPGAGDLAAKRDPVLSHAASLVGLELSAEKAGALFPSEWN